MPGPSPLGRHLLPCAPPPGPQAPLPWRRPARNAVREHRPVLESRVHRGASMRGREPPPQEAPGSPGLPDPRAPAAPRGRRAHLPLGSARRISDLPHWRGGHRRPSGGPSSGSGRVWCGNTPGRHCLRASLQISNSRRCTRTARSPPCGAQPGEEFEEPLALVRTDAPEI